MFKQVPYRITVRHYICIKHEFAWEFGRCDDEMSEIPPPRKICSVESQLFWGELKGGRGLIPLKSLLFTTRTPSDCRYRYTVGKYAEQQNIHTFEFPLRWRKYFIFNSQWNEQNNNNTPEIYENFKNFIIIQLRLRSFSQNHI